MVGSCGKCNKQFTKGEYQISCDGSCRGWYHKACEDISDKLYQQVTEKPNSVKWFCTKCCKAKADDQNKSAVKQSSRPSGINRNKSNITPNSSLMPYSNGNTVETIRGVEVTNQIIFEAIQKNEENMNQKFEKVMEAVLNIKQELSNFKVEVDDLFSKVNVRLDDEVIKLKAENDELRVMIRVKHEITAQQSRRNNLIISGVPEKQDANMVIRLAEFFNIGLQLEDINICRYIGQNSVLVGFVNTWKRDLLLKQYKLGGYKLTLENILPETKQSARVFLNAHIGPVMNSVKIMCKHLLRQNFIKSFKPKGIGYEVVNVHNVTEVLDDPEVIRMKFSAAKFGNTKVNRDLQVRHKATNEVLNDGIQVFHNIPSLSGPRKSLTTTSISSNA